ncbi:methyltransferase domain-containing protein [Adlercreutzia sp. ZJ473]|uniref:methyltransferase domain-containing protein n=1 Tax=Adlercreutzia sp. ZJ473 TaxID=2722822 RepID=UPI0015552B14|nr:methyltransferase domain-containing protein [Adlercreutzia sp. ZJ473]
MSEDIREKVKEYYSALQSSGDLKTSVCSCSSASQEVQDIIDGLPAEVNERFYGCGSPIPPMIEGCTVLDLGCGTGRDVFVLSKLVGEKGRVIGVDMTESQLEVGRKYQDEVARAYGYAASNVEFKCGYIEDLAALGIADDSIDVVISNCVINLSPFKEQVFSEVWRVLKEGGELYFSDIFVDRRMTEAQQNDPVLRGECIGGAMYIEDFRRLMRRVGWDDFRYTASRVKHVDDAELAAKVEGATFFSRTVRAFKLPAQLEDLCEQYNQKATYLGTIPGMPDYFDLDDHHRFMKDVPLDVCGNSCAMVENTRFGAAFAIEGDRSVHYGPFPGCGNIPYDTGDDEDGGCGCGCC